MSEGCPFCAPDLDVIWESSLVRVVRDEHPVSTGHSLVLPRRHIKDWFKTSNEERLALFQAIDALKAMLDRQFSPDGYNIGMNLGKEAGQTVAHLHLHVIPRYAGDVEDPRGGIRHVIPGRGNYLTNS